MMESANLHQLQDQLVGSSSLDCYGASTNTTAWTPNTFLNNNNSDHNNFNPSHQFRDGAVLNSRDEIISTRQKKNDQTLITTSTRPPPPPCGYSTNKIQDYYLGIPHPHPHWPTTTTIGVGENYFTTSQSHHHHQLGSSHHPANYVMKHQNHQLLPSDQKLLLDSTTSTDLYYPINAHNCCTSFDESDVVAMAANHNRNFGGQNIVFPSINISNLTSSVRHEPSSLSSPQVVSSSSLEMNLEALDLLTTARFGGSGASSSNLHSHETSLGLFNDNESSLALDHPTHHEMPGFTNVLSEEATKRPSSFMEQSKASLTGTKKLRPESRASCPPFKVRKEKLGDRISALQQLVAPFGKTDTASVLMEAIGYIKFLQSQVETLSVPYMKLTRSNKIITTITTSRTTPQGGGGGVSYYQQQQQQQQGSTTTDQNGTQEESPGRRDLRSRGLCLVPLSCMSYIPTTTDAQGIWSPQ